MNTFNFNLVNGYNFGDQQRQPQSQQSPLFSSYNLFPQQNSAMHKQVAQFQPPRQEYGTQWFPQSQPQSQPLESDLAIEQLRFAQELAQHIHPPQNLHAQAPLPNGQPASSQQTWNNYLDQELLPKSVSANLSPSSINENRVPEAFQFLPPKMFVNLSEIQQKPDLIIVPKKRPEVIIIEDDDDAPSPSSTPSTPIDTPVRPLKKARKEYSWLEGHDMRFEDALRQNVHNIQTNEIRDAATTRTQQIHRRTPEEKNKTEIMSLKYEKGRPRSTKSKLKRKWCDATPATYQSVSVSSSGKAETDVHKIPPEDQNKENITPLSELEEYERLFDAVELHI